MRDSLTLNLALALAGSLLDSLFDRGLDALGLHIYNKEISDQLTKTYGMQKDNNQPSWESSRASRLRLSLSFAATKRKYISIFS